MLPVLNGEAVRMAVKFGLAIGATIARALGVRAQELLLSGPAEGLPDQPVRAADRRGRARSTSCSTTAREDVGITRAHLEEDAGKSLHEDCRGCPGIDLNRAGTPLLEIVSEPDMRSAKEAVAYMKKVHTLVRYLEICDGNMQEGSFRCDANVSVRRRAQRSSARAPRSRTSTRSASSRRRSTTRSQRQIELIEGGGKVVQETRLYDPDKGETRSMRCKEEANDYRYFPDPDLLPRGARRRIHRQLCARRCRSCRTRRRRASSREYGLSAYDAGVLTASRELAAYYEDGGRAASSADEPKLAANWVMGELAAALNKDNLEITAEPHRRRGARGAAGAHRGRHDLRQDRQGSVRGDVGGAARTPTRSSRRRACKQITDTRRHREGHRRGHGEESRAARRLPLGQGQAVRLLRRPGDEGDRGQGQSGQLNELLKKKLAG